jgi:glycosyltransferase involved in cell wall biosynthesis
MAEGEEKASRLRVGLRQPLPAQLVTGKGTCLVVAGWAFHADRRIRTLQVRALTAVSSVETNKPLARSHGGDEVPGTNENDTHLVLTSPLARILSRHLCTPEVLARHFPQDDFKGFSLHSGFLVEISFPAVLQPKQVQLMVHADLGAGVFETASLGSLELLPVTAACPPLPLPAPKPERVQVPLVVICLAAYDPPPELFAKQVESIRQQTWTNWVCIIRDDASGPEGWKTICRVVGDDARFILRRNQTNLGFYKNFDALLHDVPPQADFVALSDQDDSWYPDKLAELVRRFEPGVTLVYSDMRLVDKHGMVLSPTYWTNRDNQCADYASLLLANTITGAASMFRRSLLDYILPLPEPVGDAYHDWWIGLVALATGQIAYVPGPLYDYVQHSGQVIGHCAAKPLKSWLQRLVRTAIGVGHWLNPFALTRNWRGLVQRVRECRRAGQQHHRHLVHVANLAHNVLQRCGAGATPAVLAALNEGVSWRDGKLGAVRLLRRILKRRALRLTCGVDGLLFKARIWAFLQNLAGGLAQRLAATGTLRGRAARVYALVGPVGEHCARALALQSKIAPLTLAIRTTSPTRVNLVISTIDFKYLFGGYLTVLHLARLLAERRWRVRLVIVDPCDFRPADWAVRFRAYRGLERLLDQVELHYAHNRDVVLPVSPNDLFLATSWWTAHVAHAATRAIGRDRFVYLIQEYEPGFYPLGSEAALAGQSYGFAHFALFSTELLREYFRDQQCGVFAGANGESDSVSFENALTVVGKIDHVRLAQRRQRRVLFYCRPETHAARNLFEIGILALRQAVRDGVFGGWEFDGIGSVDASGKLELAPGVHLQLLPRMNQEQYRNILPNYDVGLSLMWTPHPSLVPLDMAAAGLCTVTSVYANKTSAKLRAISTNLIPVEGTVMAVVEGLKQAERQAWNFAGRAQGAAVRWATTWETAFPEAVLRRLEEYFGIAMTESRMWSAVRQTLVAPAMKAA